MRDTILMIYENALFEEVVFLLWNYRLPTQNELDALRENFIII